jgi:hypothetical protein
MMATGRCLLIILACLVIFPSPPQAEAGDKEGTLSFPVRPPDGGAGGWRAADTPRLFPGEDLFLYMNGGAEIYHEYGFKGLLVQEYEHAGGKMLVLEIFQMSDARGAFGIYTFKTGAGGEMLEAGNAGLVENYYLNFWKGPFLVTLTGLDDSPETKRGLKQIAGAVDGLIEAGGQAPVLADMLPSKGRLTGSLKYLRGPLALRNIDVFLSRHVSHFDTAVLSDYDKGVRMAIFEFPDKQRSRAEFSRIGGRFAADPEIGDMERTDTAIRALRADGSAVTCRRYEQYVMIASGPVPPSETEEMIRLAGARLAGPFTPIF